MKEPPAFAEPKGKRLEAQSEGRPTRNLRLESRKVVVWAVPLDISPELASTVAEWLDPTEAARASRYHFEHHRRRFIARRAARRWILAELLGGMAPGEVPFREVGSGKPEVCVRNSVPLHFSASHSEEMALVAVCREMPIGVDVEMYRMVEGSLWEVRHLFSEGERMALEALSERERAKIFFDCWTRKEACVKADGAGLEIPLDSFEVPTGALGDGVIVALSGGHRKGLEVALHALDVRAEAAAALAIEGSGTAGVEWRDWDWAEVNRR